jgi:biopolymer transport protein ExbD
MAIRISDGGAGDDLAETTEINITPFIDVMLVLLIIFMVAAPLSTVDMKVNLPKVAGTPEKRPVEKVMLTLQPDLTVMLDGKPVIADGLATALATATAGNLETPLYLGADAGVAYGDLMALMNKVNAAGFTKIGLVGLEASAPAATGTPAP